MHAGCCRTVAVSLPTATRNGDEQRDLVRRPFLQPPGHVAAVHPARQADVQEANIRRAVCRHPQGGWPVRVNLHLMALEAQEQSQASRRVRVIFNQKYPRPWWTGFVPGLGR
jgi:hypothetical protein